MPLPDSERKTDESVPVMETEMRATVARMCDKSTTSGPGDVPIWVLARISGHTPQELYNAGLASGQLSTCWKLGRLMLLLKLRRSPDFGHVTVGTAVTTVTALQVHRVVGRCTQAVGEDPRKEPVSD